MQEMSKADEVQTQNNSRGKKQNLCISHVNIYCVLIICQLHGLYHLFSPLSEPLK